MARLDSAHPENVEGPWFVDTRCIRCDVARHWAPGLIEMDRDGRSYLARQPDGPEETAALWRAAEACPTQSIGNMEIRRPPDPSFPHQLTPGVWALGHTEGSVVFHVDGRWLFTGDTLQWNQRRNELDLFPEQTFQSWDVLADSMDRLSQLRVEWVFAGHGMWHNVGTELYAEQMARLGADMRHIGQVGWSQRPHAAYGWY